MKNTLLHVFIQPISPFKHKRISYYFVGCIQWNTRCISKPHFFLCFFIHRCSFFYSFCLYIPPIPPLLTFLSIVLWISHSSFIVEFFLFFLFAPVVVLFLIAIFMFHCNERSLDIINTLQLLNKNQQPHTKCTNNTKRWKKS